MLNSVDEAALVERSLTTEFAFTVVEANATSVGKASSVVLEVEVTLLAKRC